MVAEQLGEAVLTVRADTQQLQAGLARARQDFANTQQAGEQAFGGLRNALGSLAGIAGIVGIGALTQQIIQTGKESEQSKIQLKALAGAYGEADAAAASAARIQKVLGISALEARQNFAQLYGSLRGTGLGVKQLEVLFVGISKAAQLSGASTLEASSALLQLKQSLGSGRAQGDELRSVLENLPVFAQALAKELGVSVGQLKDLGSQGKITSDIIFKAAKSLADSNIPAKASAQALGIEFQNLRESIAEAFGPAIVTAVRFTANLIGSFTEFLKNNRTALTALGQSVLGIGKTLAPFIAGVLAVQAAMKAWSIAAKAVAIAQAAVLALQGPAGWAALAGGIAAATGAAVLLGQAYDGVAGSVEKAKGEAAKALNEFKALLAGTNLDNKGTDPKIKEQQVKLAKQQELNAITALGYEDEIRYKAQLLTLEREALRTGQQVSATDRLRLDNEQAILAARRQVAAAQANLDAEMAKPAKQRDTLKVDELVAKLAEANAGVRKAYLDAGISLVGNARSAAEALKGAQQSLTGIRRSNFNFLPAPVQQEEIRKARATIQPLVDRGQIAQGIDISTPEKLFQVAGFAEQLKAQSELVQAINENTKAVTANTIKDTGVYLQLPGQTTAIPLPAV